MQEGKIAYLQHPEQIPTDDGDFLRDSAGAAGDSGSPLFPPPPPEKKSEGAGKRSAKGSSKEPPRGAPNGAPAESFPGILLGDELYQHTLRVFVGSDVDIACPMCGVGPMGPMPKLKPFRVAGHFYTGMYEFDSKLAYVTLADAQKFLGTPGEVTGIEIRTTTPEAAREVADEHRPAPRPRLRGPHLGGAQPRPLRRAEAGEGGDVRGAHLHRAGGVILHRLQPDHAGDREGARGGDPQVDGRARRRHPARLLRRGALHRPLGLVLGLGLGVGGCLLLSHYGLPLDPDVYYIQKLPVVMRASEIAAVNLAALGLCCLATLYPAMLASRMRPVDGLRYE